MTTGRSRIASIVARVAIVVVAVLVLGVVEAAACPVCYGESDSAMSAGVNNGILALLAVVGGVQVAFVALFINLRKRARSLHADSDPEEPGETKTT